MQAVEVQEQAQQHSEQAAAAGSRAVAADWQKLAKRCITGCLIRI